MSIARFFVLVMSVGRQIRLVLWKNYTIRRRRWVNFIDGYHLIDFFDLVTSSFRIDLAIVFILDFGMGTNEKSHVLL